MPDERHRRTEEVSRQECLTLLYEHAFVGRLAWSAQGLPQIVPVNYLGEPEREAIVCCTAAGSTLGDLPEGTPVVFEVDQTRPLYASGWSVIVRGALRHVDDPDEVARLGRGPLASWAEPVTPRWLRIPVGEVSGRRIPEA